MTQKSVRHTSGPWEYKQLNGARHIVDANGNSLFSDTDYYPWCSANEADWPLIAAAPELFDALFAIMNNEHACVAMTTPQHSAAMAAIQKALP